MLLEKLNGTVPCLLDTTTIPPEDLSLKPSRSGADSGICEGPGAGGVRHSNGEPSSSSSGHPYNRTFSPHFHAFVELCLQRDPEKRSVFPHACFRYLQTCGGMLTAQVFPLLFSFRPSASTLIGHPFFKQVCKIPEWSWLSVFYSLLRGCLWFPVCLSVDMKCAVTWVQTTPTSSPLTYWTGLKIKL